MAVLFTSRPKGASVADFFRSTPPRKIEGGITSEQAIISLQGGQCKYALVPTPLAVPQGLEIRTVRMGWALLQRQTTRSEKRGKAYKAYCDQPMW